MSGKDDHLSGQTFSWPVILTGQVTSEHEPASVPKLFRFLTSGPKCRGECTFDPRKFSSHIRELKQRRFWSTYVNRKWTFFSFNKPWRYHILLSSVLILIETICPKIWSKSRLKRAKSSLPVDVRRSKTSLLKLTINWGVHRIYSNKRRGESWTRQRIVLTTALVFPIPKVNVFWFWLCHIFFLLRPNLQF